MSRRDPLLALAGSALVALVAHAACAPRPPAGDDRASPPPDGWFLSGAAATQFRAFTDPSRAHGGRASARLEASGDVDGAATLMQAVSPEAYRGKRVRFSGYVATTDVTGWTGLWMRSDQPEGAGMFDNMQDRALHGTTPWTRHAVVLDVAEDATALQFGILQDGPGASQLDDAALEIVGPDVATTVPARAAPEIARTSPRSVDPRAFDDAGAPPCPPCPPWTMPLEAADHYEARPDAKVEYRGHAAYRLRATTPSVPGYGAIRASFAAGDARGKRIRFTAAVKTADASGDLWLRVPGASAPGDRPGLGRGGHLLAGTADWRVYTLVLDVSDAGDTIELGAGLRGRGTLWIADVHLDIVGPDVALTEPAAPRALVNGGFEAGAGDRTDGWFMSGGASSEFEAAIDPGEHASGTASARLRPRVPRPSGYGTLMQAISADAYRGKRMRMAAQVRGDALAGRADVWLRVQAAFSPADGPGLGGGGCRLARSFAWKPCEVVFDVPETGDTIQLGIGLAGTGALWLDDVRLEEVSRDVAITGVVRALLQPINLDFEAIAPAIR